MIRNIQNLIPDIKQEKSTDNDGRMINKKEN